MRIGCLAVVVTVALSYTVWVVLPVSRYESKSQEIVARVTQARAKQQQNASDPAVNGYLDPDFLPFWEARKVSPQNLAAIVPGKENQPQCQIRSLLESLSELSDLSQGKKTELEKLVSTKSTAGLQPCLDFEAFYPKVHQVENMPLFVVPDAKPYSHSSPTCNFIAVRKLATGCAGFTDYLILTNQGDKAVGVCQDSLRLAHLLCPSTANILDLMMGISVQSIAQNSLTMVLQSKVTLSQNSLKELVKTLEQTQFRSEQLAESLESELCMGLNSWAEARSQPNLNQTGIGLDWLPGFWSREIRLYLNDYIPIIQEARAHGSVAKTVFTGDTLDWFLGRHGVLSGIMIPNCSRAGGQLAVLRKRQAFLHLYSKLRIHRLDSGHWPSKLDDLKAMNYKPLDGIDLSQVRYSVHDDKLELELQLSPADVECLPKRQDLQPEMKKWEMLSAPPWVLH